MVTPTLVRTKVKKPRVNSLWARIVLGILILLMLAGFAYGIYALATGVIQV